jgi:uncharacterized protein YjdB
MRVNVLDAPDDLTVDEEVTATAGDVFDLEAFFPEGTTSRKVTFTSSDKEIAEITVPGGSKVGTVTAKAEGEVTITVSTYNGISKTCKLTVLAPEEQGDEPLEATGNS